MFATVRLLLPAALVLLLAQARPPGNTAPMSSASGIPTISLCALLSEPADYHGKEVRVRAQYYAGFKFSALGGSPCKEYAVETTPYWAGNVVWAEFDESVEANTGPEIYGKFRDAVGLDCYLGGPCTPPELVAVGKFSRAEGDKGFGHNGRYAYQILINKIEEVVSGEARDSRGRAMPNGGMRPTAIHLTFHPRDLNACSVGRAAGDAGR